MEKDDTAPSKPNVLIQSGEATFPLCIQEDTSIKDRFVEVKFRPVSGKVGLWTKGDSVTLFDDFAFSSKP